MRHFLVTLAVLSLVLSGVAGAHAAVIVAGDDTAPSSAVFTITIDAGILPGPLAGGFTETISLNSLGEPDMIIRRQQQQGVGDGAATSFIDTEIVSLDLVGTSVFVGPLHLRVGSENAVPTARATFGRIEDVLTTDPGSATLVGPGAFVSGDSFFDVFFELDVAGMTIFNKDPHRLSADITRLPPIGSTHTPPGLVPIFAMLPDGQGGLVEVELGTAGGSHTPTPEPSALIIWSLLGALGVTFGWYRHRKPA